MRIGTRKLLAIPVAYGIWLTALSRFGTAGIIGALWCGTTTSAIIVIAHRRDLLPIMRATVGGLTGATIGVIFLSPCILDQVFLYDRGYGFVRSEIAGALIGTIAGALLLSLTTPRSAVPDENPKTQRLSEFILWGVGAIIVLGFLAWLMIPTVM